MAKSQNHYVNLTTDHRRTYDSNMSMKVRASDLESQVDDGIVSFQVDNKYTIECKDADGNPTTDVYVPGEVYYTDMSHFSMVPHYDVLESDAVKKMREKAKVEEVDDDEDDKYLDERMLDEWDNNPNY